MRRLKKYRKGKRRISRRKGQGDKETEKYGEKMNMKGIRRIKKRKKMMRK
jgi:hypothetical protein